MVVPSANVHRRKRIGGRNNTEQSWFGYRLIKCVIRCSVRGLCCILFLLAFLFLFAVLEWWWMHRRQGLLPQDWRFPSVSFQSEDHRSSRNSYTKMGTFQVLEQIPHDRRAFTQGLLLIQRNNGEYEFLEGTGMQGASQLRRVHRHTGRVLEHWDLPEHLFGEGIAHYHDAVIGKVKILQLTWTDQIALEYEWKDDDENTNAPRLQFLRTWNFTTTNNQGWGITFAPTDQVFYVSDGSKYLHVWRLMNDADASIAEKRRVAVWYRHPDMPTPREIVWLNELEWDPTTQTVLANVFQDDVLLRIHPVTGQVVTMYDLKNLFPKRPNSDEAVLNGIALTYDGSSSLPGDGVPTNEVWVTGKYWPHMYRIRLMD